MPASDPSRIDLSLDSRAVTFENPTGARGAGGTAHGGRKGAPMRLIAPGETVTLADIDGPGTIRHLWVTAPPAPPEVMRAWVLEAEYDDLGTPSISVPMLDFFGLPHGRPVAYSSALTTCQEGRGFNSYIPMPFRRRFRLKVTNHSPRRMPLYYQLDYSLQQQLPEDAGLLHVSFRRENPTTLGRDFVIEDGLQGPGRFLGCVVGVRVLDWGVWYGEGEVKVFIDDDTDLPTICGTGLEDYVGTAWGMGPHHAPWAGAPLDLRATGRIQPDFVGFYRWHGPDPIVFRDRVKVTIQQIGFASFSEGDDDLLVRREAERPAAGTGWSMHPRPGVLASGICERVDDYCATAFTYCREAQSVPVLSIDSALTDIGRREGESPLPFEAFF